MKIVAIACLSSIFTLYAQPNFQLWNKHIVPVYYSIGYSTQEAAKKPMMQLRAGKWTEATIIDNKKPVIIAFSVGKEPTKGQRIDTYTMMPNKTLFLRVGLPAEKEKFKEIIKRILSWHSIEADNYIFGPQTGPLLGFKGVTEQGLPLKNNINARQISKSSVIYNP